MITICGSSVLDLSRHQLTRHIVQQREQLDKQQIRLRLDRLGDGKRESPDSVNCCSAPPLASFVTQPSWTAFRWGL